MYAIQARYRGRELKRAEYVRKAAAALSTLEGVEQFTLVGVEDIASIIDTAEATCDTALALLAAGDWAVAIAVMDTTTATSDDALAFVHKVLGPRARAGTVKVGVKKDKKWAAPIQAAFVMLAYILSKRTAEGREATSLMRSGLNQIEAAEELGISKQAISQRLQAAGWQAELAGYQLAIDLLQRANID